MTWLLYNPQSGSGKSKQLAHTLQHIYPKQHRLGHVPLPDFVPMEPLIILGGDGSWHHVNAKLTHSHPAYLAPTGTMNLLAHAAKFTTDCRLPKTIRTHRLPTHALSRPACINWSFGWDAHFMHLLSTHRNSPGRLPLSWLKTWAHTQPIQRLTLNGENLGLFNAGVFSLLPSYGHQKLQLAHTHPGQWQGWLFRHGHGFTSLHACLCKKKTHPKEHREYDLEHHTHRCPKLFTNRWRSTGPDPDNCHRKHQ